MEFKPGTRIQIGRVKSNTLAIKDSGISSKHLTLEFEPRSGKWTVTDLNSSNGTFLNAESLKPSIPYSLSDGDVIKIGELTAIEVKVSEKVKEEEKKDEDCRPRRNPRRRAGKNLGVIDENFELGLGVGEELGEKNDAKGQRRRGRLSKNEVKGSGDQGEEPENLGGNVMRRPRSSKMGEDLENAKELENLGGNVMRRTRSSKRGEVLENAEEKGNVVTGRMNLRRRGMKKLDDLENVKGTEKQDKVEHGVEDVEAMEKQEAVEDKKVHRMNLRTRGSTREENLGESQSKDWEVGAVDVVEGRTRKGTRTRRNLAKEAAESVENGEMREGDTVEKLKLGECCEGEHGNLERDGADEMQEKEDVNLRREGLDGQASASRVKKSGVQLDLEKMTMGEWFDYLEEYLPKQIIDQTEEMILEMRQNAEKFHEFMLQQKAGKEKDAVALG